MSSIFTKIINREIPGYIIEENDHFIAFLDVFPMREGHTLVVPKKEIDYIFDLDDEHLKSLMVFAKSIAQKIKKVIPCNRIGISVIGLEVPHAHVHLVPMDSADDVNFTRPKMKISPERMEEILRLIQNA